MKSSRAMSVMLDHYPMTGRERKCPYAGLSGADLRNEWSTPPDLFDELRAHFGAFSLDACANGKNTKVKRFNSRAAPYRHEWAGRVFCNPPYSGAPPLGHWVRKAYTAAKDDGVESVLVVPSQLGSAWFHNWAARGTVYVPRGRIAFVAPPGVGASSPRHDSLIIHFDPGSLNAMRERPDVRFWHPGEG